MIDGVNDTPDQASKLAAVSRRLGAHINLIALNPTPLSPDQPPTEDRITAFIAELEARGSNVTRRDTRGRDIDAACGQLRLRAATEATEPGSLSGTDGASGTLRPTRPDQESA